MPWPKASFQSRLTNTRAVSGLSGETSQREVEPRRRAGPSTASERSAKAGAAGVTTSPDSSSQLPRGKTRIAAADRHGDQGRRDRRFEIAFAFFASASLARVGSSAGAIELDRHACVFFSRSVRRLGLEGLRDASGHDPRGRAAGRRWHESRNRPSVCCRRSGSGA